MNSGILLVDKPQGITSHGVVSRVRKAADTRKVGHAGTLDPMATGLLVVGINSSTRLLTFVVGLDKTYKATIRLGVSTTSDDADGEVISVTGAADLASDRILEAMTPLTGDILQVPTTVSAIKVGGKRAYDLARQGIDVELKARPVTVSRFDVVERRDATHEGTPVIDLDVVVDCTSGTYIRALARDLGSALGVGGHLTALRRTRIGPFDVDGSVAVDDLDADAVDDRLQKPADVARILFDVLQLDAQQTIDLGHGKKLEVERDDTPGPVAAITPEGRLLGLVSVTQGRAKPIINFPTDEVHA
ncbi:tRNA pseudouridine(55) synthase TruB [Frondihabitans sp. 4ASC-45]|uniref:tRNA pseudouridine(55) synthase TruB n=1 Tax=Frondihabitans sp. 4ASC-45 TaxID=3111636 RepID=UPI003C1F26C6